jgi:hypothetical protein
MGRRIRLRSDPVGRKRGAGPTTRRPSCDALDGGLSCSLRTLSIMERMLLLWDDLDDTVGIVRHILGNAWHGLFRPR